MIIEQVSIRAAKGRSQEIGRGIESLIGPTEVQQGCLRCRLLRGWHEPDELVLQATWETAEDLTNHLQSENYKRLLQLMELSAVTPVIEFCMVQEVRGLDLVQEARGESA